MAKAHIIFKGYRVTSAEVILPDTVTSVHPVLWLLHDRGERGDGYLRFAPLEALFREKNWYVVCITVGNNEYRDRADESHADWESYVAKFMWDMMHQIFPSMSSDPVENYIAGIGMGGEGALRIRRDYRHKYGRALRLVKNGENCSHTDILHEIKSFVEERYSRKCGEREHRDPQYDENDAGSPV